MHAPRFLGSMMLSKISINGSLISFELIRFFKSLRSSSDSDEIVASGSCLIFFVISNAISFFSINFMRSFILESSLFAGKKTFLILCGLLIIILSRL